MIHTSGARISAGGSARGADALVDYQGSLHATAMSVCNRVARTWSMFAEFHRWLVPPRPQQPIVIYANRYQIHAYALPTAGV